MKRKSKFTIALVGAAFAALAASDIYAQDKYSVKVPNGLAFVEFRGYETWEVVSVSQSGEMIEGVLANPVMIKAFQAGLPAEGKFVPDGSKMPKIHCNAKNSAEGAAP